ncbi:histidine kinase [Candidatus Solirubrobacter pratensis]|uniref:histidine kinase n=1 Tax=Candidatus Solirubrobacter pratensis TaxID=1298857 RepID=UPI000564D984|nr:histidine kinase [Candidatus Solirubrobacter pratensis]
MPRGRHKVFLGMAAGVGKTYRMLQEGRTDGRDVAIGLLETHGRAETEEQARGLEVIPRRVVMYRGAALLEMDLPAIIARTPDLCLIDELAHTNAPGLEHVKRYEDVEDVLAAGIDVYSTLNVQHLDSLNDQLAENSGVRVRETVPDTALQRADEIVVVDVTPETLLDRLRAGKVYPAPRIDAALNGFFRIENLVALRETALRQVAEETVTPQRVTVGERLLALVRPQPSAQRLVRRAWRSAQRLGADLDVLWVQPPGHAPSDEQARALSALRQLTSVLGAHLIVVESDDIVAAAAEQIRERGTTYVLVGESGPRRWLGRLREPLPQRIMAAAPRGVDVRIVASRRLRETEGKEAPA